MRKLAVACVALGLAMAACGGGNRQPMVPDQPSDDPTLSGGSADAGADLTQSQPMPAASRPSK